MVGIGGGGGYGGNGGAGSSSVDTSAFGSITQPTNAGHGGGAMSSVPILSNRGGAGGGAIQFNVAGWLALGGSISVNGAAGVGQEASGGSGGGVLVNSAAISGGGTISANGGAAGDATGGGGGGGRIAVYSGTNQFTGRMFAFGGAGGAYGGAGTIFTQFNSNNSVEQDNSVPQLLLDNGGSSGASTPLSTISGGACDLTVTNGAAASLERHGIQRPQSGGIREQFYRHSHVNQHRFGNPRRRCACRSPAMPPFNREEES